MSFLVLSDTVLLVHILSSASQIVNYPSHDEASTCVIVNFSPRRVGQMVFKVWRSKKMAQCLLAFAGGFKCTGIK